MPFRLRAGGPGLEGSGREPPATLSSSPPRPLFRARNRGLTGGGYGRILCVEGGRSPSKKRGQMMELKVGEIIIHEMPSERSIKRNTKIWKEIRVIEKAVRLGAISELEAKPMLEKLNRKFLYEKEEF